MQVFVQPFVVGWQCCVPVSQLCACIVTRASNGDRKVLFQHKSQKRGPLSKNRSWKMAYSHCWSACRQKVTAKRLQNLLGWQKDGKKYIIKKNCHSVSVYVYLKSKFPTLLMVSCWADFPAVHNYCVHYEGFPPSLLEVWFRPRSHYTCKNTDGKNVQILHTETRVHISFHEHFGEFYTCCRFLCRKNLHVILVLFFFLCPYTTRTDKLVSLQHGVNKALV